MTIRAALFVALVLCASTPALAQGPDDPKVLAEAAKLMREGEAAFQANHLDVMVDRYARAYALVRTPRTIRNLAVAELLAGKPIAAYAHFKEEFADSRTSTTVPGHTLAEDHRRMQEAYEQTAHVELRATEGAVIAVDGHQLDTMPVDHALDLTPGPHTFEARLGAQTARTEQSLPSGKTSVVELHVEPPAPLPQVSPPPIAPAPATAAPPPPAASWWTTPHTVGVVAASGGIVSFGLNLAFHQEAINSNDPSTHNAFAYMTWVTLGVGAAALATGAVLMLWPDSPSRTIIAPTATPTGAGFYFGRDF